MKTQLRVFLQLFLLTLSFFAEGQSAYRYKVTQTCSTCPQIVRRESVPGSNRFDIVVNSLPPDAARGKFGGRSLLPYAPEPNGVLNVNQFGTGKFYSSTFQFNIDWDGWHTPTERNTYGVNTFTQWDVKDAEQNLIPQGQGFAFLTENFLGDQASGYGFCWQDDLQGFLTKVYNKVPGMGQPGYWQKYKYLNYNIEAPLFNEPGNATGPVLPGYGGNGYYGTYGGGPDWNTVKNTVVKMESTGETRTLEQIANLGPTAWALEYDTRFANRMSLLVELAKKKGAPGTLVTSGMTAYITTPNRARQNDNDFFKNQDCNVNNIGGNNGFITLNLPTGEAWTVKLTGLPQSHEDMGNITTGYGQRDFKPGEFDKIFVQKLQGTQNLPYVWQAIQEDGPVADEKGRLQLNRSRQLARFGRKLPMLREMNMHNETHLYVLPWLKNADGTLTGTRLFYEPYQFYSRYVVTRFMAGNEPGWGWHLFPQNPNHAIKDPATDPDPNYRAYYNMALHSITALYQARADMQIYEQFYQGSTYIEDPEVQINTTGDYSAYTGTDAWDTYPQPQKPAYLMRYKAVTSPVAGWRVVIVGGVKQGWTDEHTDNVRAPGGQLNGNFFQIKLRGPGAQVFEFFVKNTDSGQMYQAAPSAEPSWEKAAYAGRVGVATTTTPTNPNPTPTTGYSRVIVLANSIGHNKSSTWGNNTKDWGMDASAANKDFLHILTNYLKTLNPNVDVREMGDPRFNLTYGIVEGPHWEQYFNDPTKAAYDMNHYQPITDWKPDLIIWRLEENVQNNTNFGPSIKKLIDKLREQNTSAKVLMSTSVWETLGGIHPANSAIIRSVATERGYNVAELGGLPGGTAGQDNHPNDTGHQNIADKLFAQIPGNTVVVTPPPTVTATGGYDYPTVTGVSPWLDTNTKSLYCGPIGPVTRMETDNIRVEIRALYGGAMQITDKATGYDLVDFLDKGRENEVSIYSGPNNFSDDAASGGFDGIGWNPLTTGDIGCNGGVVLAKGFVTGNDGKQRLYVKSQMISWPHSNNRLLEIYNERWIYVNGKEVDVKCRITTFRSDKTKYEARLQQYPCFMRPGKCLVEFYTGNNPYSNGTLTGTDGLESKNPDVSFRQAQSFFIAEPWLSMYKNGVYIFLNTDRLAKSQINLENPHWGDCTDEGCYIQTDADGQNQLVIDSDNAMYLNYGFFVTTNKDEGRAWANGRPKKYGSAPNFIFSRANGRNEWYGYRGTDQKEPFTSDNWTFVTTPDNGNSKESNVTSPAVIWKASDVQKIYIKMKYQGAANQFRLSFLRNGQVEKFSDGSVQYATIYPNGFWDYANQGFTFNPIKDGQFHVYEINCAANPAWKDVIQQLKLNYGPNESNIPGSETWEIASITATNPDGTSYNPPSTGNPITTPSDWVTFSDQNPWVNDLFTMDNGTVRATFRKSIGGGLWYLGKSGNDDEQSMVQVNMQGDHWDQGRGLGWAGYGSPFANELFCVDGACTGTGPEGARGGIGNNPCMGGSVNPNDPSQVVKAAYVNTSDRGQVFCIQVRPKQWDLYNRPSHYLLNMEYWFTHNNTIGYRLQVVTEPRPSNVTPASKYESFSQEEITMYVTSKYRRRIIQHNGQDMDLYDSELNIQESRMSEKGVGTYSADLSYGLTIWTPDCVAMKTGHGIGVFADDFGINGPRANSYGFMQSRPERNLDNPGSYTYQSYLIIGSRQEALARINTLPAINSSFDFDLSSSTNQQHGWANYQCRMIAENGENALYIGDGKTDNGQTSYRGGIRSPIRRWNASDLGTLIFRAKIPVGINSMQLKWYKANSDGRLQEYTKIISIVGNGQETDYAINTSDGNFNGIIHCVGLQVNGSVPDGTKIILKRIRKG